MKKHIPNILSSTRLLSPFVLIPLITAGNYLWAFISLTGFLLTDALDGYLARKWNVQSQLGAKIDAVADKVILLSLLLPLIINNPIILVTLGLELSISTTNVIRKMKGYNPKTLQIGRIKMILISLFMALCYLGKAIPISNVFTGMFFSITTIFQLLTEYSYIQELCIENKKSKFDKKLKEMSLTKHCTEKEEKLVKQKNITRKEELLKLKEEIYNMNKIKEEIPKKKVKKL